MNTLKAVALVATPLAFLPTAALAQDDEQSGAWEIDAEVATLTDYRFRGISLSGKDPEVTAEVSVSHGSGFYAGTWLSNVDLGDATAAASISVAF